MNNSVFGKTLENTRNDVIRLISSDKVAHKLAAKPNYDLINELIEVEYGFRPKIIRTHQLGKVIYNRIQPIAVTFVDLADAAYLLEHAKQLRESVDDNVFRMVFFNQSGSAGRL